MIFLSFVGHYLVTEFTRQNNAHSQAGQVQTPIYPPPPSIVSEPYSAYYNSCQVKTISQGYCQSSAALSMNHSKQGSTNLNKYRKVFSQGNALENFICKNDRLLFRSQCINSLWPSDAIWRQICVNIGSSNALLPDGTKPLPEPMLTDHKWSPLTFILKKIHKRCLNRQWQKFISKLRI